MIEFDSCCFCFPLRTGSLIIGYLSLVSAIGLALQECVSIGAGFALIYNEYVSEEQGYLFIGVFAVLLIFTLISIAFTIVLLVGLHKEKPGHVKAYLIFNLVLIVVSIVLFSLKITFTANESLVTIGIVMGIVLNIYYLLVIRSHYMKMKEQNFNNI